MHPTYNMEFIAFVFNIKKYGKILLCTIQKIVIQGVMRVTSASKLRFYDKPTVMII